MSDAYMIAPQLIDGEVYTISDNWPYPFPYYCVQGNGGYTQAYALAGSDKIIKTNVYISGNGLFTFIVAGLVADDPLFYLGSNIFTSAIPDITIPSNYIKFSDISNPRIYNSSFGYGFYYTFLSLGIANGRMAYSNVPGYNTMESALAAMDDDIWNNVPITYPITYRLTNATAPDAPTEAEIGDTVTVDLEFPEGYGIVNPQTDIYVTCNGITVPSSYSAGRLVFTMPDPT